MEMVWMRTGQALFAVLGTLHLLYALLAHRFRFTIPFWGALAGTALITLGVSEHVMRLS
jgi:hypothetical protein